MSTLDQFFEPPQSFKTTHPTLLWLDELLEEHPDERPLIKFERPWDGFVFAQAWLTLLFPRVAGRDRRAPVRQPWDKSYDDGLLDRGIRAEDREQEAARFALGMAKDFETIELRVGKDYFSSLLVYCLRGNALGGLPAVRAILSRVTTLEPSMESESSHTQVREAERVLSARGRRLAGELKYPREEAEEILGAAIARCLDERFHVTLREHLGMGTRPRKAR
jgi:hypothetical protein